MIGSMDDYFARAKESDITPEELINHPGLVISDEGFCVLDQSGDDLIFVCAYGNGKFWQDYAESEGRAMGCKRILMATKRNPDAFTRKYGYTFAATMMEKKL